MVVRMSIISVEQRKQQQKRHFGIGMDKEVEKSVRQWVRGNTPEGSSAHDVTRGFCYRLVQWSARADCKRDNMASFNVILSKFWEALFY